MYSTAKRRHTTYDGGNIAVVLARLAASRSCVTSSARRRPSGALDKNEVPNGFESSGTPDDEVDVEVVKDQLAAGAFEGEAALGL